MTVDSEGLHRIANTDKPDRSADIVFIHGLAGGSHSTWRYGVEGAKDCFFWPEELGKELPDWGIWLLGHESGISHWFSEEGMALEDRAANFALKLNNAGLGNRPLILIAHSMGGLVVKEFVTAARDLGGSDWTRVANAVRGIVFLGTPHHGSHMATVAKGFAALLRTQAHLKQMEFAGPPLDQLHKRFMKWQQQTKCPVVSYVETRGIARTGTLSRFLPRVLVVPRISGDPKLDLECACYPIGADHTTLAKPNSPTHDVYTGVRNFIENALKTAPPTVFAGAAATPAQGSMVIRTMPTPLGEKASDAIGSTVIPLSVPGQEQLMKGIGMPQFGSSLYLIVPGQSPAQLAQSYQPKPQLEELFEIITEPDEVPKALFRTESAPKAKSALVPYQVGYVQGREGVADVKEAIGKALNEAKGRLLICGAAGIGKTREVAEFARARCARDWKICIARSEGDGSLGELATLPPELADAKLLVIIDNLHSKLLARSEMFAPYAERLEAFLASLARQVPENLQVIAMAHSGSHFQREFDLDLRRPNWRSFGVYQLPGFTLTGLQQMLAGLVAQAGVAVDQTEISKLVENSDRKPRTLFINVNLARKNALPLTGANWGPNEGDLWKESFLATRGKYPAADKVYAALRLLTDADLPKRKGYVTTLSTALAGADTSQAIEALVDKGLLGLRQGMLEPFSEEQLVEVLKEAAIAETKLSEHWESVISAVQEAPERPSEWQADLVTLAYSLNRHQLPARAEEVATFAIEQSPGSARAYTARAGTRFLRADWSGSESDLTVALERDPDADAYFLRGTTRNLQGDFPGMAIDMDNAIKHGRTDSLVYSSRGLAHYQQQRFREAEEDFGTAIKLGQHDTWVFFLRGVSRYQLSDFAGTDEDLTAALDHGLDLARLMAPLEAVQAGDVAQALKGIEPAATSPSRQDDAILYGLRGLSRFVQTKYAEAESDLTLAIQHGFSACMARMGGMLQKTSLPSLAKAKEQLAQAQAQFGTDASLYYLRALARGEQGKLTEAEADFDEALATGFADPELYSMRGTTRLRLGKNAEAEADFDRAIELGLTDTAIFLRRGRARLAQQKLAAAEADLTAVIERGPNAADAYFLRGATRIDQGNNTQAEEDLSLAIQGGQDDSMVYFLRGLAHLRQQNLAGAEADLTIAIDRGKDDSQTRWLRGAARFDQANYAAAEEDLAAAITHGQDDGAVYFFRGSALYHQQKLAEAEADLSLALDKGKADAATYSMRGAARIDQGKNAEAEQDFDAAIERGRDDAAVFFVRGTARYRQEKFAEAEADLSLALNRGRKGADIYSLRGDARLAQQNGAEAEQDFSAAIESGMNDAEVYRKRGRARFSQGKMTDAEKDFSTGLARGQDDAFTHFLLGLTRFELKRYDEAERAFDASLSKNQDYGPSYLERGRARLFLGKMEGAEQDFDAAIAREPEDFYAYHLRGLARYGQGNLEGAVADYDLAIGKGKVDAAILSNRVSAHVRLGRLDEAGKDCARVTDLGAESPEAQGCLGMLDLARNNFANALSHFQSADKAADGKEWHFWLGLAHLLAGHPEPARTAYRQGVAESVLGDVRIALDDFEFWIAQNQARLAAEETRHAITEIRGEMSNRLNI